MIFWEFFIHSQCFLFTLIAPHVGIHLKMCLCVCVFSGVSTLSFFSSLDISIVVVNRGEKVVYGSEKCGIAFMQQALGIGKQSFYL